MKLPPWNSWSWSLPIRARPASSLISAEIASKSFASALVTIGVIRPESVATAIEISDVCCKTTYKKTIVNNKYLKHVKFNKLLDL